MNIEDEVVLLKKLTKSIRKKRYGKSRLDPYENTLLALNDNSASVAEIQRWLETKKIKVVWTTVYRWLEKHG